MKTIRHYLLHTVLAGLVGFAAGYAVACFPTWEAAHLWLYRWQTLVAGGFAIIAAVIGAYFINQQIRLSERQEGTRLVRQHTAVRAAINLTLSFLSDYAAEAGAALITIHGSAVGEAVRRGTVLPEFPKMPLSAVADIERMIATTDSDIGKRFAEILVKIQIQGARIREMYSAIADAASTRSINLSNVETYIIDAAWIHAQIDALFPYCRGETDFAPPPTGWADISAGLRGIGLWQEQIPRVHEKVVERIKSLEKDVEKRI